jgi:hypothetical protein
MTPTPQSYNDQDTQEFDQLIDTLVQRSGLWTPPFPARRLPLDDLHRTIQLDDPIRTNQVRGFVVAIERVLRGTGALEVRRDAIAAIVAVLARAYAANPDADASQAAQAVPRIKDSVMNMARKWFGTAVPPSG